MRKAESASKQTPATASGPQRIDKWLWHARVVRTRNAAADLVARGHVRLNGVRVSAASRAVRTADVVTIALERGVRILRVTGFLERRGSPTSAHILYEELRSSGHWSGDAPSG
jgi:ribosome-associated heat shock protein Hsp15